MRASILFLTLIATGCMPALAARPARVQPGFQLEIRETVAVRGPSRGTCFGAMRECDFPLPFSAEAVVGYGSRLSANGRALSVGGGVAYTGPLSPFVELYQQRRAGPSPWGVGLRLGIPTDGWSAHALELRGEGPIQGRTRRAWTTTLAAQVGSGPDASGTAITLAHSEGVVLRGRFVTVLPSFFMGVQHAQGEATDFGYFSSPSLRFRNAWSVVGGFGATVRIHGR